LLCVATYYLLEIFHTRAIGGLDTMLSSVVKKRVLTFVPSGPGFTIGHDTILVSDLGQVVCSHCRHSFLSSAPRNWDTKASYLASIRTGPI